MRIYGMFTTFANNLLIFTPVMTADIACLTSVSLYDERSFLRSGTATSVRFILTPVLRLCRLWLQCNSTSTF